MTEPPSTPPHTPNMSNEDSPPTSIDFDDSNEDDGIPVCHICASSPCEWEEFGPDVKEQIKLLYFRQEEDGKEIIIDENGVKVNNNIMRKHSYRFFTYLKYGHLGKGNRMNTPLCVIDEIRKLFPEEKEEDYIGFQEK